MTTRLGWPANWQLRTEPAVAEGLGRGDARVGGVDGAKGKWLFALVEHGACEFVLFESFAEVVARVRQLDVAAVGVDMPIGLPDRTGRVADIEARQVLGARRSSLFPTPASAVLSARDYEQAQGLSRAAVGRGMSKQAFHLLPMIRQVRSALDPTDCDVFFEAHPETTFAEIAGHPLPPKKSVSGIGSRLGVLEPFVPKLADALALAPEGCAIDDALDAVAAAWSADRFLAGTARVFGAGEGVDASGYPLQILA